MRRSMFFPVMTYPDATPETVVSSAVNFAAMHGIDVNCGIVEIEIPPIANPWTLPLIDMSGIVKDAEKLSRDNGKRLGGLMKRRCEGRSVRFGSAKMQVVLPGVADELTEQARFHDLVATAAGPEFRSINEAVIFGAGRPVLLLPQAEWYGTVDHVAIAWDGGRAAARALGDALWLLERAGRVSILFSTEDKTLSGSAAERLFAALGRRGLPCEMRPVYGNGHQIGQSLQIEAMAAGADLMVMGGYGHSRIREFLLGGATAGVLENPMLPVLMAH